MRASLALKYGWTFDAIDAMTFDAIEDAMREGKPPRGVIFGDDAGKAEISRNWRRYYLGL